jgi:hypothetical protein
MTGIQADPAVMIYGTRPSAGAEHGLVVAMVGAGRHGVQAAPGDPGRAAAPLGLGPGDRVLLAVFPARDALAAYWFAVVD